ncbi:hypothetical protein AAGT00_04080 [Streptomyces cavourensis]
MSSTPRSASSPPRSPDARPDAGWGRGERFGDVPPVRDPHRGGSPAGRHRAGGACGPVRGPGPRCGVGQGPFEVVQGAAGRRDAGAEQDGIAGVRGCAPAAGGSAGRAASSSSSASMERASSREVITTPINTFTRTNEASRTYEA